MERAEVDFLQDPLAQYKHVQGLLNFRGDITALPVKTATEVEIIKVIDEQIADFAERYPEFLSPCEVNTFSEDGSTLSYEFPANPMMTSAVQRIIQEKEKSKRPNG